MTPVPPFVPHAASIDRTLRRQLVVNTLYVPRRDGDAHYEIHLAPDTDRNAPITVLVTRDEAAYQFALALEGKATRVDATWHHARTGNHRYCVLDTLQGPTS